MNEEPTPSQPPGSVPELVLFHHETLDVYRVGLQYMRWLNSLPGAEELCDPIYRQLDKAATSLLLNIAEGNGRYSEMDHRRFLDVASSSAVKSAAYLDLCEQKSLPARMDLSLGMGLLGRITAMLSSF